MTEKGTADINPGFGLKHMRDRIHEHGGTTVFESTKEGFRVKATVPLNRDEMANGGIIMVRILIVDDQELMRDGLATILDLRQEIEVAGVASNGKEAFEKAGELRPDIVLMDIRMPIASGVEGTKLITTAYPDIKVLMLTTFNDSELIFEALEEGASGYLLKDMPTDAIVQAIMTVQSGGMVLPKELTADIVREMRRNQPAEQINTVPEIVKELTERELEVLQQLGLGLNNKEIAGETVYIRRHREESCLQSYQQTSVEGPDPGGDLCRPLSHHALLNHDFQHSTPYEIQLSKLYFFMFKFYR